MQLHGRFPRKVVRESVVAMCRTVTLASKSENVPSPMERHAVVVTVGGLAGRACSSDVEIQTHDPTLTQGINCVNQRSLKSVVKENPSLRV